MITYATHFADLFDAVADRFPDVDCVVQGDRRRTWSGMRRRARGVGLALVAAGVGRQGKVAQYLYNCPEYIESVWACFDLALVPVNTNYRYKDTELVYLWTNADVSAVVFHGCFTDTIERVRPEVPHILLWLWVDDGTAPCPPWAVPYEAAATAPADAEPPWPHRPDDITLLYTGGTTGLPKGVMWRMSDYCSILAGPVDPDIGIPAAAGDPPVVHLPACPLMHGVGLHTSFKAMSLGGTTVLLERRRFDPVEVLDTVQRERVTSLAMVGDAFGKPIADALEAAPSQWDVSSLRQLTSSGVMWSAETKRRLLAQNPTMTLMDTLGSSEAMGVASSVVASAEEVASARFRPTPNAKVITEDGRFVEPGSGEVGLVAVRGFTPIGYYKDPQRSAMTFRYVGGERWSFPGDHATLAEDGAIVLLGRGSVCINRGGEKVFPEEVEEALKAYPGVRDAVVVGVPHDRLGEEVNAVIEAEAGAAVDVARLIESVRGSLAGFKAPKRVFVVQSIERAANGKADYARWRAYATEGGMSSLAAQN